MELQKVYDLGECSSAASGGVAGADLLDRVRTLQSILNCCTPRLNLGLSTSGIGFLTTAVAGEVTPPGGPPAASASDPAGAAAPPPAPPREVEGYLQALAGAAKELAFANGFGSVVAGAHSESDEAVDLPLYLGPGEEGGGVGVGWGGGAPRGLDWAKEAIGVYEGGERSAEVNAFPCRPDQPAKVVSLLPRSVASHSAYSKLADLLGQLDPKTRIEFEVITDGSKVPCFVIGRKGGHWVGLASCAVFT